MSDQLDERLPSGVCPDDMGSYPNPDNPHLTCIECGTREGHLHRPYCLLSIGPGINAPHVGVIRRAFEAGYRRGLAKEMRVLETLTSKSA